MIAFPCLGVYGVLLHLHWLLSLLISLGGMEQKVIKRFLYVLVALRAWIQVRQASGNAKQWNESYKNDPKSELMKNKPHLIVTDFTLSPWSVQQGLATPWKQFVFLSDIQSAGLTRTLERNLSFHHSHCYSLLIGVIVTGSWVGLQHNHKTVGAFILCWLWGFMFV